MGIINLKTIDQIGMVVADARKTASQWEAMLGIGPWRFVNADDPKIGVKTLVGLATMENGVVIELIQVVEGRIFHSEFVDSVGEGLHHLGFAVDDVEQDTDSLVDKGAEVVMHYPHAVSYVRFKGDGGVITELYRKPQPKKTD